MWKNYLKIAFRNLRRNKGYASINVVGLAVGMAACLLIALYVRHELSYDHFHEKSDRIYRVTRWWTQAGETGHIHATPAPLAPALEQELPYVENTARLDRVGSPSYPPLVSYEDQGFEEEQFYQTDPSFFDIFSFELLRGNPETALTEPNTVVLTEATSRKYFSEDNPIGKVLRLQYGDTDTTYQVVGIVENPPSHSHFQFDFLASLPAIDSGWERLSYETFVEPPPGTAQARMEDDLARIAEKYQGDNVEKYNLRFTLQPLTKIHLYDLTENGLEPSRHLTLLYLLSAVALLVLLIACINYVNLATAHSLNRTLEVGVRKALGAGRIQLMRQFLGESLLTSLIALVLALGIANAAAPLYTVLAGKEIAFSATREGFFVLAALGVLLVVAGLSGSYPALLLSRLRPDEILRSKTPTGGSIGQLRKGLIVVQFAASVTLIICTGVTYYQLTYLRTTDLGFNQEHVVVVRLQDLGEQMQTLKTEMRRHPNILRAAASSSVPSQAGSSFPASAWGSEKQIRSGLSRIDSDFATTFELKLIEGQPPRQSYVESPWITDEAGNKTGLIKSAVLVNEAFVREMGLQEPVGSTLTLPSYPGRIVGVVKDFHFESLRKEIAPLVLQYHPYMEHDPDPFYAYLSLRIRPEAVPIALDHLRKTYESFSPTRPFDYFFVDNAFEKLYRTEEQLSRILAAFAILTIVIACLGLFGLAAHAAERRTKEIGIRKVFGASTRNIVALLSKDFLWLVLIAFVFAAPVAYYAMSRWLEDFAYRIELGPWLFVGAGVLALIIAMATVSYQATKAALTNPSDTLRYE